MTKLMNHHDDLQSQLNKINELLNTYPISKKKWISLPAPQIVGLSKHEWSTLLSGMITKLHEKLSEKDVDGIAPLLYHSYLIFVYIKDNTWPTKDIFKAEFQLDFLIHLLSLSIYCRNSNIGDKNEWEKIQEKLEIYWEIVTEEIEEKLKGGTK